MQKILLLVILCFALVPCISLISSENADLAGEETALTDALSLLFKDNKLQKLVLEPETFSSMQKEPNNDTFNNVEPGNVEFSNVALIFNNNSLTVSTCAALPHTLPSDHSADATEEENLLMGSTLPTKSPSFYSLLLLVTGFTLATHSIRHYSSSQRERSSTRGNQSPPKAFRTSPTPLRNASPEEHGSPELSSTIVHYKTTLIEHSSHSFE